MRDVTVLLVLALVLSVAPAYADDVAFRHVTVVDVVGGWLIRDQVVRISGERIVEVVPSAGARIPKGVVLVRGSMFDYREWSKQLKPLASRYKHPDELVQRVDHLVYATPDLDRGIAEIEKLLGIRATFGGKHPGRGTKNAFIALGPNSFLEIVAPDPDQPPPKDPRPFFKGLVESRLVRWFINSRDIRHDRDEAVSKGVPYGEVKAGSRQRPDGVQVSWQFTDPAKPVTEGVVPFIIDWGDTPHPSQSAAKGATLISLRAEHPDPREAKRLLLALGIKIPVKKSKRPALIATMEGPRGRVELK